MKYNLIGFYFFDKTLIFFKYFFHFILFLISKIMYVMKKIFLLLLILLNSRFVHASTILGDNLYIKNETRTWSKSDSPYIIRSCITLSSSTLFISDIDLIFESSGCINSFSSNISMNNVNINDNTNNGIINLFNNSAFNGINLNVKSNHFVESYNSSINLDNLYNDSANNNLISLYDKSNLSLQNSKITNNVNIFYIHNANEIIMNNNEFLNNAKVMNLYYANSVKVNFNDFENNNIAIESYMYDFDNLNINFENNYFESDNPKIVLYNDYDLNLKNRLFGPFKINIFSKMKNVNKNNCCSNILFLPGLMASRLYIDKNQLWEPNRNADVSKLFLNSLGNSISTVYTKDIILKTNILNGYIIDEKIYEDFIKYLYSIKNNKLINDYNAMPYDWRLSPDMLLDNGIKLRDRNIDIIDYIKSLQKTSKTGKVTIITHSNGGLVAKKILLELKKQNLENIIDKVIFVAMPEYGTPQAITSLIYGHSQSIAGGLILKSSVASDLAKNMSTAYSLLPSDKYYSFIKNNKVLQQNVLNTYSGLNIGLYEKAKQLHLDIDNMSYSSSTNIYQIVGTGLNTVSDIMLSDKNKILPLYNKNGDGVVMDLYNFREGKIMYLDLKNSKYEHYNIMNHPDVIYYTDLILKNINIDNMCLDYNKIIKNNNYKLLQITPNNSPVSKYLNPFDMEMSIGFSPLNDNSNNSLYIDKYNLNSASMLDTVSEVNNNRFETMNKSINYLYTDNIDNITFKTKQDYVIDIEFIENNNDLISITEFENINLFKNSELKIIVDDDSNALHLVFPITGSGLKIENNTVNNSLSLDEKIDYVINSIKTSNMDILFKEKYTRRLESYKKSKDQTYLNYLKNLIDTGISSINKVSYSPVLKARYAKMREDYMYLKILLLKL